MSELKINSLILFFELNPKYASFTFEVSGDTLGMWRRLRKEARQEERAKIEQASRAKIEHIDAVNDIEAILDVPGIDSIAVKISPGFFDNPKLGLPSLNGLMVLFSARTGTLEALLLDNGYLTDIRTAAAGAVAAGAAAPALTLRRGRHRRSRRKIPQLCTRHEPCLGLRPRVLPLVIS